MNCKEGDLAIIVKVIDPRFSDNIGKIVRCLKLWGEAENYGWMWHIHSEGSALHVYNVLTHEIFFSSDAFHPDDSLRPIRGEKEVKDEQIFLPEKI